MQPIEDQESVEIPAPERPRSASADRYQRDVPGVEGAALAAAGVNGTVLPPQAPIGYQWAEEAPLPVPRTIAHEGDGSGDDLQLVVVEADSVTAHDLPALGTVVIGRGTEVDVPVADPGASAQHARIHVQGGAVAIEDLDSRNGTQVRGQRIASGERVALSLGEAAMVAGAVLLVQRKNKRLNQRRSLPHGYFELRLAEECLRAQHGEGSTAFSLARLDLDGELTAEAFAEIAGEHLRPTDILGTYAPDAYEILLLGTASERPLDTLLQKVRQRGAEPRVSFAHFPGDGRTAHSLIEKACAGLRPPPSLATRPGVIVRDERMRDVYRLAERAAARDINVLILGETGVGKEILAETIHRASKRADKPFLCLNCGAVNENLRESELFGYERGAFTDAKASKPGLLEAASGGTVFLDEIGEMSSSVQAMLLRAIETKQVTRVGGVQPRPIDVRFIAATHRDLVQEIKEKRFRSDLYYRLNGIALDIPPLRERRSEIRPLAEAFLVQLAPASGVSIVPRISEAAVSLLESHRWDGNIRELRNIMDRALLLSDGGDIEPEHLPIETIKPAVDRDGIDDVSMDDIQDDPALMSRWTPEERAERARVIEALRLEGGNQTRAARRLGISRSTMVQRLEAFKIRRPNKRS
jgi:DNA-binding NtrC family response regulator